MSKYLLYCRAGYESDLASEIDSKLALLHGYGYAKLVKNSGYLHYTVQSDSGFPRLSDLIFARQKLEIVANVAFDDTLDRITKLIDVLGNQNSMLFGDVMLEYADTESGRTIAKFCKKFTVPLRAALRKNVFLTAKQNNNKPRLHLFFESSDACIVAVSKANDRSDEYLGIRRLKFPQDAPSRSTLKLEEAITFFYTPAQQSLLFKKGMTAVDLGACPGGWTYQLVKRGVKVEAIDNGAIADSLMKTGMVKHFAVDGFVYQPLDGHVDWLVCDMIEKPDKVASLMVNWLKNNWASAAIFNLKLPMKKRFQTVDVLLKQIAEELGGLSAMQIQAKHLYHNRDEVTVSVIKNSSLFDV
ncbi:23S rRNA (cytidine(2498)-2'-O)-methyltransferase RlmM [Agaribacter flavus]|uniref:23S rRNA (Cytidine(2498)-2'-O)-methyltransferase RlmM n=1 Tax=Agaribacter flavus TaxID=1902781 RepID=A0ABV7FKZ3_9ALTE